MGIQVRRAHLDERAREAIANIPPGKIKPSGVLSDEEIQKHFGERVRHVRKAKGISQEALALKCHLDRAFVGSVERGERNISLVNIYKIARGLGILAKELMP